GDFRSVDKWRIGGAGSCGRTTRHRVSRGRDGENGRHGVADGAFHARSLLERERIKREVWKVTSRVQRWRDINVEGAGEFLCSARRTSRTGKFLWPNRGQHRCDEMPLRPHDET